MRPPFTLARLLPLYAALFAVTFLPRYLPMTILSRFRLPGWFERWLGYIPAAVLAALTAQSLFLRGRALAFRPDYLLAALPAGLAAWLTRNLFLTVLAGMAAIVVLRAIGLG